MKLYSYFQSSGAYRVRIALNLKGLQAEMEYVNLLKGEQRQVEYAKINPQMLVPALVDNGRTFTQSLAIIEYLEEAYPAPPLLPRDTGARAHARALALVIACDTAPLGNLKVRKYVEEKFGADHEAMGAWMRHWIEEGLNAFEKLLAQSSFTGRFCCGDTPGIADCCLMPQIFNALRWKCDVTRYPMIARIAGHCDAHPAFAAAHPSQQADAA